MGPLHGIRVLDLSHVLVGNALTVHLSDFGAEVIKIERPGGDGLRRLQTEGHEIFWKVLCRNKKSVVMDLKNPDCIDVIIKMIDQFDVVVENFRPGDLERFGLHPERLFAKHPALIIVRASGWGNTGPYRSKLGFGTLIEAFSGFAAKNGFPDKPPLLPNLGLADLVCGLNGAFATMVALREVAQSGRGQIVDLSILDCMAALLATDPAAYALSGEVPERVGNRSDVAAPRNIYRTKEGRYVALSASTQEMTEKLFRAIGRSDLVNDPRFRTNADRLRNVDDLDQVIQDFLDRFSLEEALALFDRHQVTVGPVNDVSMFMSDQHVVEREVIVDVEDPDLGWIPMPSPAVRLSSTPASIRTAAPTLGQHTREVLLAAGLSPTRIDQLEQAEAIFCGPRLPIQSATA